MFISCQELKFNSTLSKERIDRAIKVFGKTVINRFLCFALYLLGITRSSIAKQLEMPTETVKTFIKNLHHTGIPAFEDRRRRTSTFLPQAQQIPHMKIKTTLDEEWLYIELGTELKLRIPQGNRLQTRTILLTLFNSGLISSRQVAEIIGLSSVQTRAIAINLEEKDIYSLLDKRQGQKKDYVINPEIKVELIQQFAANAATKRKNSSQTLADDLNERCNLNLSSRTIRFHIEKLGLSKIKHTLPELIGALKKKSKK